MRKLSLLLAMSLLAVNLASCHGELREKENKPQASETSAETAETAADTEAPSDIEVSAPLLADKIADNGLSFDESKSYSITFWAKNDTNLTQVAIYNKAIEDFEKIYPNIDVNLKLYTDYGRIYSDVITNIQTDTTPNVCITYPDHIATYMTGADTMVELDKYMFDVNYGLGGSKVKFDSPAPDEVVPKFLEECMIGGAYYALPYMRSTEACYVNKTYVEKLGFTLPEVLTWDFVWEVSEAAMEKNADGTFKVNGQSVLIPFIYKSTDNMMIQMLAQKNAGYSTSRGEVYIFNDVTKSILDEIAVHAASKAFSTFKISSYPANYLNAGQCIFAVDSTAGATWMGSDAPNIDIAEENLVEFETEVMTVPQFDTEAPEMISQGPSVCVFNKDDKDEVMASWLFCQYLLTNEVQLSYSSTEGYVPVTLKAQESDEYKDYMSRIGEDNDMYYRIKLEAAQLLIDNVDNSFVTPVFNGSASLRNAAGQLIEETVKTVNRKKTVDHMKTFENVTALYKLDQIEIDTDVADDGKPNAFVSESGESESAGGNVISIQNVGGVKKESPFPIESKLLIIALSAAWVLIAVYSLFEYRKRKNAK